MTFRLYSTKFFLQNSDLYEDIEFDEESQTASLKEDTMYDKSLKSIIIAHGNGVVTKWTTIFGSTTQRSVRLFGRWLFQNGNDITTMINPGCK